MRYLVMIAILQLLFAKSIFAESLDKEIKLLKEQLKAHYQAKKTDKAYDKLQVEINITGGYIRRGSQILNDNNKGK